MVSRRLWKVNYSDLENLLRKRYGAIDTPSVIGVTSNEKFDRITIASITPAQIRYRWPTGLSTLHRFLCLPDHVFIERVLDYPTARVVTLVLSSPEWEEVNFGSGAYIFYADKKELL